MAGIQATARIASVFNARVSMPEKAVRATEARAILNQYLARCCRLDALMLYLLL